MIERERSPYLKTEKIIYQNPPSMTSFKDNINEAVKQPIHVNMNPHNPIKM